MKFSNFLIFVSLAAIVAEAKRKQQKTKKDKKDGMNKNGLCVVGCTPYVNPDDETAGILKWKALVEDMAESCDIMVHVGDTKAGAAVCNEDLMVSVY